MIFKGIFVRCSLVAMVSNAEFFWVLNSVFSVYWWLRWLEEQTCHKVLALIFGFAWKMGIQNHDRLCLTENIILFGSGQ